MHFSTLRIRTKIVRGSPLEILYVMASLKHVYFCTPRKFCNNYRERLLCKLVNHRLLFVLNCKICLQYVIGIKQH